MTARTRRLRATTTPGQAWRGGRIDSWHGSAYDLRCVRSGSVLHIVLPATIVWRSPDDSRAGLALCGQLLLRAGPRWGENYAADCPACLRRRPPCPRCGAPPAAGPRHVWPFGSAEIRDPELGDFTVCLGCATPLRFDAATMTSRELEPHEHAPYLAAGGEASLQAARTYIARPS